MTAATDFDIELRLLLEGIFLKYQYDFRDYSLASLRRRLARALEQSGLATLSALQDRVLHDPAAFRALLPHLTVQASEMFRDPSFFRALREKVVPLLRTWPSLRVWVAGCAGGEELWSLAILLHEEGLLRRATLYATDIDPDALARAERGIYPLDRLGLFEENYRAAGGTAALRDYCTTGYGAAAFDRSLRKRVVFSDHSLATDQVFAEAQLVTCRNVLIYFNRTLQDRAIALFRDSLARRGFLGLGAKESLRFSAHAGDFEEFVRTERIYRRRGGP